MHTEMCAVELYKTINCIMLLYLHVVLRRLDIANPFYFNLSSEKTFC